MAVFPANAGTHSKRINAQCLSLHQKANPIQWIPACAGKTEEDQAVISRMILTGLFAGNLKFDFIVVAGFDFERESRGFVSRKLAVEGASQRGMFGVFSHVVDVRRKLLHNEYFVFTGDRTVVRFVSREREFAIAIDRTSRNQGMLEGTHFDASTSQRCPVIESNLTVDWVGTRFARATCDSKNRCHRGEDQPSGWKVRMPCVARGHWIRLPARLFGCREHRVVPYP